jgi:hypothetical protein
MIFFSLYKWAGQGPEKEDPHKCCDSKKNFIIPELIYRDKAGNGVCAVQLFATKVVHPKL